MIAVSFAVAFLLAQGAPAASSPSPAPAASAPATAVSAVTVNGKKPPATDDGDQLVCRSETVLGSLFPKKVCAQRKDFTERTRVDQAYVRQTQALRPYTSN